MKESNSPGMYLSLRGYGPVAVSSYNPEAAEYSDSIAKSNEVSSKNAAPRHSPCVQTLWLEVGRACNVIWTYSSRTTDVAVLGSTETVVASPLVNVHENKNWPMRYAKTSKATLQGSCR